MVNINNLSELVQVVDEHNVPTHIIQDVDNRIKDWLLSGGNEYDSYILNQCKYVEKYINKK